MASSDYPVMFRAAEVVADGRTLTGVAVPFGRASKVTDNEGRTWYREQFHRAAFTKALKERAARPFPLGLMHPWQPGARTSPVPLGPTTFHATPDALEFTARMSNTRDANEALELLHDGVLGDVSIGYRGIRQRVDRDAEGDYTHRLEAVPFELSLAIVGTGQHDGAQVLAVRAGLATHRGADGEPQHPRLEALRRRLAVLPVDV